MTEMLKTDSFRSSFGYSVVKWEIDKYASGIFQDHWEFESPEFSVRGPESQKTKWKLILSIDPAEKDTKQNLNIVNTMERANSAKEAHEDEESESVENKYRSVILSLNLERSRLDEGPETVFVEWKTHCLCLNGAKAFVAHEKRFFNNGDNYGVCAGILFNSEEDFCYTAGEKIFLCQMLVYNPNIPFYMSTMDSSVDIDLCALSEDLQWVFEQEKFCDLEILVGEKEKKIHAHKAMLSSRNKKLESMITGNDSGVIKFPKLDYNGVVKILGYIYSNNILEITEKPSISVYDSAAFMNLSSITELYIPEELNITTNINVYYTSHWWTIENFSEKTENCLISSCFFKDILDRSPIWRVHLYPRDEDGESKYVAIFVEYIEGNLSKEVCVDCAIIKDDQIGIYQNWKTFRTSEKPGMMFEDVKFIKRETLLRILEDDVLKLAFKVRMRTSIDHSFNHEEENLEVSFDRQKNLEQLAEEMLVLHQSNDFTDVVLCIGEEEIKAHKFVLCARSLVLSDMLKNNADRLVLSDMKLDILKIILNYMYCASLDVTDVKILLDVYVVAENLLIPRLKDKCSQVLQRNLTVDTVCDILALSDDYSDALLKEAALEFISCNNDVVLKQDEWLKLKLTKPFLCEHVGDFFNSSVTETKLSTMSLNDAYKLNDLPCGSSEKESKEIDSLENVIEIIEVCSEVENISSQRIPIVVDTAECVKTGDVDESAECVKTGEIDDPAECVKTGDVVDSVKCVKTGGVDDSAECVKTGDVDDSAECVKTSDIDDSAECVKTSDIDDSAECVKTSDIEDSAECVKTSDIDDSAESMKIGDIDDSPECVKAGDIDDSAECVKTGDIDDSAECVKTSDMDIAATKEGD